MSEQETAHSDDLSANLTLARAAKAIELCRDGQVVDGVAMYRQILRAKSAAGHGVTLPVGLHLRFLEAAGLNDAATAIRQEALKAGQNVSMMSALNRPPAEIAADYRALFARGVVNSGMVADFLLQLSRLGETAELQAFLNVDRLVRRTQISLDADAVSSGQFWQKIAKTLLDARTEKNWQEAVQSVRRMYFMGLEKNADEGVQRVLDEIRRQVSLYLADVGSGSRAVLPWAPQTFRINPWAVISLGDGYNTPHIHRQGWITGVLYIAGPDETAPDGQPVGALRIGAPPTVENTAGWPDLAVAPTPGTLVLMPSYFTHWTTPLGKPGLRISIAFDVIDLREE